jgi:hypothetical protein
VLRGDAGHSDWHRSATVGVFRIDLHYARVAIASLTGDQLTRGFLPQAGLQGTFSIDLIHADAMLHR